MMKLKKSSRVLFTILFSLALGVTLNSALFILTSNVIFVFSVFLLTSLFLTPIAYFAPLIYNQVSKIELNRNVFWTLAFLILLLTITILIFMNSSIGIAARDDPSYETQLQLFKYGVVALLTLWIVFSISLNIVTKTNNSEKLIENSIKLFLVHIAILFVSLLIYFALGIIWMVLTWN